MVLPTTALMGEGALKNASLGARSSGGFSLCVLFLIRKLGPIVYFTTVYMKEKGE